MAGGAASRPTAWIAVALGLAVALRLAFGLGYWVDKPLSLDEQEYLLLARSLASGRGYGYPPVTGEGAAVVHFERPPAYAAAVAGALVVSRHPWTAAPADPREPVPMPRCSADIPRIVPILQAFVGAAGVWLVGWMAWRAAGSRAAVAASFAAAVAPPLVWSSGYALGETMYSTLALATAALLMRASETRGPAVGFAVAAGVVAGVAVLTKEGLLLFLPLAVAWLAARRRAGVAAALTAGVLVVLLPWVWRNHAVHGRFVLTAAHGGVTFWTGNNALAGGEGDLAANPAMKQARNALEATHAGRSPQEMDAVYYREALEFIRTRPWSWALLEGKKLFYTVVPIGPSYLLHSLRYRLASWVTWAALASFGVAGLWRLGTRASVLWPLLLLALSAVLMNLVFFPQERFRIPVIDPALIVCAAACAAPRPAAPGRGAATP
jgi:4-amino-4-deoxy-L-arabinose transferase-like glycosyltransferase